MAWRPNHGPIGAHLADLTGVPALTVRDLSFRYGKRQALERVGFQVQHGRFTALLGPNGAGKTMLFSLVTRLLKPPVGAISILGLDLVAAGSRALSEVGVVSSCRRWTWT